MKTLVKSEAKLKTLIIRNRTSNLLEKENSSISIINFKFYQKIFVLLISFSTILIFPESPIELGNICKAYNSIKICNVW